MVKKIVSFMATVTTTGLHWRKKKISRTLSSRKKNFVRFCPQYYCMGLRKNSIDSRLPLKKIIFWLQYYYATRDLEKTQLALDLHQNINIFSFPATVLLWCMEVRKKINCAEPSSEKKNSFLTTVVHSDWCDAVMHYCGTLWVLWCTNLHSIPPKKNLFLATVLLQCF